jgi:hypothetical protein
LLKFDAIFFLFSYFKAFYTVIPDVPHHDMPNGHESWWHACQCLNRSWRSIMNQLPKNTRVHTCFFDWSGAQLPPWDHSPHALSAPSVSAIRGNMAIATLPSHPHVLSAPSVSAMWQYGIRPRWSAPCTCRMYMNSPVFSSVCSSFVKSYTVWNRNGDIGVLPESECIVPVLDGVGWWPVAGSSGCTCCACRYGTENRGDYRPLCCLNLWAQHHCRR